MDKREEMTTTTVTISETMLEASSALAEGLAQSEAILGFKAAQAKLQKDNEALRLLKELSEIQQKARTQQSSGKISESDIISLRALQGSVGSNETIQEYEKSRVKAVLFLQEINQEISELLGLDFAMLTRRSSGCC